MSSDSEDEVDLSSMYIKKMTIDESIRVPVASFESMGIVNQEKFKDAKTDVYTIKPEFLTPTEARKMKHILAMEVPLKEGGVFRFEGSTPYAADEAFETFAFALDTETGEATLYPTDVYEMMPCAAGYGDHPWRMRMDVKSQIDSQSEDDEDKKAEKRTVKTDNLTGAFGTAKKQRKNKSRRDNQIDIKKSAAGSDFNSVITKAPDELRDDLKVSDENLLPPMNLDATHSREVIDIDDIIPPDIAELITCLAEYKAMMDRNTDEFAKWEDSGKFPKFFIKELKQLSSDETRRQRQCLHLLFSMTLIRLFNAKSEVIRKVRADFPEAWPKKLLDFFFRRFTKENLGGSDGRRRSRVMPTNLKDKALIHAIFVMLKIHENSWAANDFLSDLSAKEDRIKGLCNIARLLYFKKLGTTWIEIRLPLPEVKEVKKEPLKRKR